MPLVSAVEARDWPVQPKDHTAVYSDRARAGARTRAAMAAAAARRAGR